MTTHSRPTVSIAYHSGYGHTDVLAEAVRAGVAGAGADARLIRVDEITPGQWSELDDSDAIVFGAPTYMGTASSAFHVFAEATSKRFGGVWRDKLAAGFTNSGAKSGDKLHTLQFFTVLAAQLGMNWVSLGLQPGWNSSQASEHDLNRLGFYLGAAATAVTPSTRANVARIFWVRLTSAPSERWVGARRWNRAVGRRGESRMPMTLATRGR
ncbi:flavodoxin family protein [Streptomyces sp. NPDC059477]|uniref:flavodoxin family protein n=1 Tax=Streptomyces sp. NPDC059477 TaxID=3346847 RepID=UPI00368D36FD